MTLLAELGDWAREHHATVRIDPVSPGHWEVQLLGKIGVMSTAGTMTEAIRSAIALWELREMGAA